MCKDYNCQKYPDSKKISRNTSTQKNIEKQFFNFRKYYGGIIVKYTPRLNGERGTRQKAMINCENELANYTLGQRLFFRIE